MYISVLAVTDSITLSIGRQTIRPNFFVHFVVYLVLNTQVEINTMGKILNEESIFIILVLCTLQKHHKSLPKLMISVISD